MDHVRKLHFGAGSHSEQDISDGKANKSMELVAMCMAGIVSNEPNTLLRIWMLLVHSKS